MRVYDDFKHFLKVWASQVVLVVTNLPARAGDGRDTGSVPELGRSPGGGHSNPLQYSCLGTPWPEEPGGSSPGGRTESDTTQGLSATTS